jgi:chorismate synthase
MALSLTDIDRDLAKRQVGYGASPRMKIEHDHAQIVGGVLGGRTTGAPIALTIDNLDHEKWKDRDIAPMTVPRPGHADLTAAIKYGYRELRLALERASARETAARVAVGAVCRKFLGEFGVVMGSYVAAIGAVEATLAADMNYLDRFAQADRSDVRCPDPIAAEAMRAEIRATMEAKDTVGGIIEVVALNVPPGLGSHVQWDRGCRGA